MMFKEPPLHRRTGVSRASTEFLHRPARSLRRPISLLSMFPAVAGVPPGTSQSIKPRERDLGDLHLFFLVRILTRPTNHPRHAVRASNNQSKPVRPHFVGGINLANSLSTSIPSLPPPKLQARDRKGDTRRRATKQGLHPMTPWEPNL